MTGNGRGRSGSPPEKQARPMLSLLAPGHSHTSVGRWQVNEELALSKRSAFGTPVSGRESRRPTIRDRSAARAAPDLISAAPGRVTNSPCCSARTTRLARPSGRQPASSGAAPLRGRASSSPRHRRPPKPAPAQGWPGSAPAAGPPGQSLAHRLRIVRDHHEVVRHSAKCRPSHDSASVASSLDVAGNSARHCGASSPASIFRRSASGVCRSAAAASRPSRPMRYTLVVWSKL